MTEMNRWTGAGRLTHAPRFTKTSKGDPRVFLSLAVTAKGERAAKEVAFVPVTAYGEVGACAKKFDKGAGVAVTGRLRTYKLGETGYGWEIRASKIEAMHLADLEAARAGRA